MFQVALSSVRGHLVRFILTAIAVALGVGFVAGTFALSDSLNATFDTLVKDTTKDLDAYVQPKEGDADGFNQGGAATLTQIDYAETLQKVPGVRQATADLMGNALLVGANETVVRRGGAPTFGVALYDGDPVAKITTGRKPNNATEIVVEKATLELSGHTVGETTDVVLNGDRKPVTIVGEAELGGMAGASVILFDPKTAQELFAPEGKVSNFSVYGDGSKTQAELVTAIQATLPEGFEAVTGDDYAEKQSKAFRDGLSFITNFLLIFAIIALIVGAFIIVNTFLMLLGQRTQELALLRAIGTRKRQVLGMVLTEATFIGILGSIFGALIGWGLASGMVLLMQVAFGMDSMPAPTLAPRTVAVAFAVGIGVTIFSAFLPALTAARTPPVAAMRSDTVAARKPLRTRGWVSLGCLIIGLVCAAMTFAHTSYTVHYLVAAAAFLLIAFVIGAALAVKQVITVIAAPIRNFGIEAQLANDNAVRNPRRTAITASALMIGLALVSGVGVLASSTEASVKSDAEQNLLADFTVQGGFEGLDANLPAKIGQVSGVATATSAINIPASIKDDATRVSFISPAEFTKAVKLTFIDGSFENFGRSTLAIKESVAKDKKLAVGDQVTVTFEAGKAEQVRVTAIYANNSLMPDRVMHTDALPSGLPQNQQRSDTIYVLAHADSDLAAVEEALVAQVKPLLVVTVLSKANAVANASGNLNQLLVIVYALLGLSIVIAALGVANTLAMSLFERTREIGLLRAVGLRRGQLWRMVVLESSWTALFGAILGTILGLTLGVLSQSWLKDQGVDSLAIPWATIGLVLAGSVVVGTLAALVPAFRATRIKVLDAIASS